MGPKQYEQWTSDFRAKFPTASQSDIDQSIVALWSDDPEAYLARGFLLPEDGSFFEAAAVHLTDEPASPASALGAQPINGADSLKRREKASNHLPGWTRYYEVTAKHARSLTNEVHERRMNTSFGERLPLVKIQLPRTNTDSEPTPYYDTNAGRVLLHPSLASEGMKNGQTIGENGRCVKRDHWYGSIDELVNDWPDRHLTDVRRVDLVTTAQIRGFRFAAISFYLGYRGVDVRPSFYVIEAGEAINSARQVYFGEGLVKDKPVLPIGEGPAVAKGRSTYNPTRLSDPNNHYHSVLGGEDVTNEEPSDWDPKWLTIIAAHSSSPGARPYMTVEATFDRDFDREAFLETATSGTGPSHRSLMCRSGGRVAIIGKTMGDSTVLKWWEKIGASLGCRGQARMYKVEGPTEDGQHHEPRLKNPGTCLK